MARPLGLILAGGAGRRLGGVDKALLPLGGRPLLAHVVQRLAPQCADLILSANGDAARFARFGLAVVADAAPTGRGPLAGIQAGLAWLAARRPDLDRLASVPVDCPFLPHDLVARLDAGLAATGAPAAIAHAGGRLHPTVGLWTPRVAPALEAALARGAFAVAAFVRAEGGIVVDMPDGDGAAFLNVNRPDDLARAADRLRSP